MNPIIIDLQSFTTDNNKFIPKELAAYNGYEICHYVFKPPFPFDMLKLNYQRSAKWLIKNYHSINWQTGFTDLHQFQNIMYDLSKKADTIYVKGKEKADYIQKFTNKIVVEMDEHPAIIHQKAMCFYHNNTNKCVCALTNVHYLYNNFMRCKKKLIKLKKLCNFIYYYLKIDKTFFKNFFSMNII